ncbi:50S ribosomal protein L16 [Candidatus Karelsulcia muelleri]|uniref:Large ribosomal subunit protein uL16 n=1 Tax=Candidatus Karelsulcia muelleri TaxID=336810 RepID=A0A346E104_9FLAO|nr:50S ribosomal protein L16 [Candidatus Karelsulcia muelleri]AXN02659.1 LSU ribosomal protein L16p (L10e) [Candidatus Karelsulcia muelleri]WDI79590.1 50S ribosomal protein L16 [Candidatus Karelsulcia muelleri]WDR78912.1 50S ribosomal protein L16 [Candidatus Karelsulcia muelleri]
MLKPKRKKFEKLQKGRIKGYAKKGTKLNFGIFGLKNLDTAWLSDRQIEAARIVATRYMKRQGKLWINIFPNKPITKKPQEVRMGKGKGAIDHWVAVVKPGRILIEIDGVTFEIGKEALRLAANKLPIRTKLICL